MKKKIKIGFIEKKLERKAPFPLVASDKNSYLLEADISRYESARELYVYAKRADGEIVCDSTVIEDGKVSYILKQGIYAVPGELYVRLVLKDAEDAVLTAAELSFEVLPGSCEGTPAEDYNTVEGFIAELAEMREMLGYVDVALDSILEIQNSLLGVSE